MMFLVCEVGLFHVRLFRADDGLGPPDGVWGWYLAADSRGTADGY